MINKTTINSQEMAKFSSLSDEWWNKDGLLKTLHDINPVRLAFIEEYVSLAGKTILDVGCGGGILSEALAKKGAYVTGIDAEEEGIKQAIAHANAEDLRLDYQCIPIEALDNKRFDIITCMEMLEHVDEPQEVIHHCRRLLKPGGFLFLSTINRSLKAYLSAIIAAEYLLNLLPRQTHDYQKFIQPAELAAIVRKEGLNVIGLKGIAYNPISRMASLHSSVAVNYLMTCVCP